MEPQNAILMIGTALSLLAGAWCINNFRLWSLTANHTLPWLCSAVAVALLRMSALCLITQTAPKNLPAGTAVLAAAGVLFLFAAGMVVDWFIYGRPDDWLSSAGE